MNNFSLSEFGRVTRWYASLNGTPILLPEQTEGGNRRGGSFVAAPIFGDSPKDVPWRLPRHGFMHGLHGEVGRQHLISQQNNHSAGYWVRRLCFYTTPAFPWTYEVVLITRYTRTKEELMQMVRIMRSWKCDNPDPMPVSAGFVPYFATHSEPFVVRQAGVNVYSSGVAAGETLRLSTQKGTVTLVLRNALVEVSVAGMFDELRPWTSDVASFLCIMPVGGKTQPIWLAPGEEMNGVCTITYRQTS